jgi:hypothetical protein
MEAFLDTMAKQTFGVSRKENKCVTCGSKKVKREEFRDVLSWREFHVSRICQTCQDKTFQP